MADPIIPAGTPLPRLNPGSGPHGPGHADVDALDLRTVVAVLRRHVRVVAACTALAAITGSMLVLRQRPEYRATATIRLKNERQALTGGMDAPGLDQMLGKAVDPLRSQLEVMRSRSVAAAVVRQTGVRLVPIDDGIRYRDLIGVSVTGEAAADTLIFDFGAHDYSATTQRGITQRSAYGRPMELSGVRFTIPDSPRDLGSTRIAVLDEQEAVEHVQRHLRAVPLEQTDVVDVAYTDPDPDRARTVVNAAVAVFQEANANDAQQLSRRRRLFVEEQLAKTDSVLALAQAALSEFRRREEVFSSRTRFAAQQTGMLDLEVRREELAAERRVHARLLDALRRAPAGEPTALRALVGAPGVAENPVIGALYQQLVRYQGVRDSLTTGRWARAPSNPDVQRLDALIAATTVGLTDAAAGQLAAIDARLAALAELQAQHAVNLQAQPDKEAEEMRLIQRVETAGRLADQLREEYQKARIAEAIEVGQVEIIDLAPLPREPIGSGKPLKLSLALMLGLMVGSGAAFLREHLNTRVSRKDEMEALLGVPGLAVIPRIVVGRQLNGGPRLRLPLRAAVHIERPLETLVTVSEDRSAGAEAYRSLRTNLLFSHSIQQLRSVMITSPMASEGKTTTSANLAVAFAQQGLRVLLIDCDLRRARLHDVFDMSRNPGLTDVISGMADISAVVRPVAVSGLSVVTAGTLPPNPAELFGSPAMRKLLEELRAQADLLIVDAAPILVAGDASILGRIVDGTVIVIRAGRTERAAAHAAMQQLRIVGARVVGAVLNDPDAKVASYDGYGYYAYGSYGAGK